MSATIAGAGSRRHGLFDTASWTSRTAFRADILAVLLCGAWSLWLGMDVNEDLFNYHLYNAFALLEGKRGIDFTVAGFQGYFNPALDVPYYLLNRWWPAPLVGFVYGALHGLVFCLVHAIARCALVDLPAIDRVRVPLLLAVAGALTVNFLCEVGNSMGDDTTALFALAAVLVPLLAWRAPAPSAPLASTGRPWAMIAAAGVLVGLASGLKLTNAISVVALAGALLAHPAVRTRRVFAAIVYGAGVLVGFATTGGPWLWTMWRTFGNPLFPQFSRWFPHPLVASVAVMDTRWGPRSLWETIVWPVILSLDPRRVGEAQVHQVLWAVVYALYLWWAVRWLRRRSASGNASPVVLDPRATYLVVFVATGFVAWAAVFSIYRYLVAVEVLAPLVAFILLRAVCGLERARRLATRILIATSLVVLAGGVADLGHTRWKSEAFALDAPPLAEPGRTTILLFGQNHQAWLAALFPASVAFVGVGSDFPASKDYGAFEHAFVRRRGGPLFAVIEGSHDGRKATVDRIDRRARSIGLLDSAAGCRLVGRVVAAFHLHLAVSLGPNDATCALVVPANESKDTARLDGALADRARRDLQFYGYRLAADRCTPFSARAGQDVSAYQLCVVDDIALP